MAQLLRLALGALAALMSAGLPLAAADSPSIVVAAASDLAPIEKQMKELAPSVPIRFVFGSSGQLAQQILAGAPLSTQAMARSSGDQ